MLIQLQQVVVASLQMLYIELGSENDANPESRSFFGFS